MGVPSVYSGEWKILVLPNLAKPVGEVTRPEDVVRFECGYDLAQITEVSSQYPQKNLRRPAKKRETSWIEL
jgi:hypothetical protein